MFNIYAIYSKTYRNLLELETPDQELITEINKILTENYFDHVLPVIITDKNLINEIYNYTDIPIEDSRKVSDKYTNRKNAQVLAPLLILLLPKITKEKFTTLFNLGKAYSEIALLSISAGYKVGNCICYEKETINKILFDKNLIDHQRYDFANSHFLSIGHDDLSQPYNWDRSANKIIEGETKIDSSNYIFTE